MLPREEEDNGRGGGEEEEEEREVLSDIHVGDSIYAKEVISRYYYYSVDSEEQESERNAWDGGGGAQLLTLGGEEGARASPARKRKRQEGKVALTVVHRMATPLPLVGLQVWSAAFLLADYLLSRSAELRGCTAVELGAGPGVPGLIVSQFAKRTFLTDYHPEILELLARNVNANQHLCSAHKDGARVRQLDWLAGVHPLEHRTDEDGSSAPAAAPAQCCLLERVLPLAEEEEEVAPRQSHPAAPPLEPSGESTDATETKAARRAGRKGVGKKQQQQQQEEEKEEEGEEEEGEELLPTSYIHPAPALDPCNTAIGPAAGSARAWKWQRSDVRELQQANVLFASDVVYDDAQVEGLFHKLKLLMPRVHADTQEFILALEKRFNFCLQELSVVATAYKTFLGHIRVVGQEGGEGKEVKGSRGGGASGDTSPCFEGRRLPLDFPQRFDCYQREKHMELWRIKRIAPSCQGL